MRDFQLRDDCPAYPGTCVSGSQQGPIVDTMIDNAIGRVYLSVPRVVAPAAKLAGFLSPEEAAALRADLEELGELNTRLTDELASVKQQLEDASPNVVKVDDLATLLGR